MKKKIAFTLSTIVSLLVIVYLGAGYAVYDQLSKVTPGGGENAVNTPAHFQVLKTRLFPTPFAGFDTTPYRMPQYEVVRFSSREPGLTLAGWYVPGEPEAPVVVLTHGLNSCKCDWGVLVPAGMLHQQGFNVLLYDLRNHGESESDGGRTTIGNKEYLDLLGAWDWLIQEKGFTPAQIGVFGASLGGGTTLMAFGQEPRLAAAFVDSPFFDLRVVIDEELTRNNYPTQLIYGGLFMARVVGGVDLLAHSPQDAIVNDAGRPIFVVHGTGDTRLNVHHSHDLATLAQQTGANVTTWFPEGVDHVEASLQFSEAYEQRLVAFFTEALGQ